MEPLQCAELSAQEVHLPCREVEGALRTGLRIVAQWERVTQDLTSVQWPVHAHAWQGRWVLSPAWSVTRLPEGAPA